MRKCLATIRLWGRDYTIAEAAKWSGISGDTIRKRLSLGWPPEEAVLSHKAKMKQEEEKAKMQDDKDKMPKVVISPHILKQMANDPELEAAMQKFSKTALEAMWAVKDGRYANFDEAMAALTGAEPRKLDEDEVVDIMREEGVSEEDIAQSMRYVVDEEKPE